MYFYNHDKFIADADLLIEAVDCANRGWRFEVDYGEAKFESGTIIAKKYGRVEIFYESSNLHSIFHKLKEIDFPEN